MGERVWACGDYRTYQRHVRRGETIDTACQAAATVYMRAYRKAHPEALISNTARRRALTALAQMHSDDYRTLYADALGVARAEFWGAA